MVRLIGSLFVVGILVAVAASRPAFADDAAAPARSTTGVSLTTSHGVFFGDDSASQRNGLGVAAYAFQGGSARFSHLLRVEYTYSWGETLDDFDHFYWSHQEHLGRLQLAGRVWWSPRIWSELAAGAELARWRTVPVGRMDLQSHGGTELASRLDVGVGAEIPTSRAVAVIVDLRAALASFAIIGPPDRADLVASVGVAWR